MLTLAFNSKHHCAVDSCVVFNVGTGLLLEYSSNELKSTTATALIIGASDKQGVRVWLCRFFSGIFLYGIILLWTGSAELLSPPCGSDSNCTKTVDMFMSNLKTLNAKNRQVSPEQWPEKQPSLSHQHRKTKSAAAQSIFTIKGIHTQTKLA